MSEQSKTLPDWRLHLIRVAKCEEFQADSRLAQAAMLHIETTETELAEARAALREAANELYNPFEPNNQSRIYRRILAFLAKQIWAAGKMKSKSFMCASS